MRKLIQGTALVVAFTFAACTFATCPDTDRKACHDRVEADYLKCIAGAKSALNSRELEKACLEKHETEMAKCNQTCSW